MSYGSNDGPSTKSGSINLQGNAVRARERLGVVELPVLPVDAVAKLLLEPRVQREVGSYLDIVESSQGAEKDEDGEEAEVLKEVPGGVLRVEPTTNLLHPDHNAVLRRAARPLPPS